MLIQNEFEKTNWDSHRVFTEKWHGQIFHLHDGGSAFFSGNHSFFSQVIGWPQNTRNQQEILTDLEAIEDFYRKNHHHEVGIETTEFINQKYLEVLGGQDYQVRELTRVLSLKLDEEMDDGAFPEKVTLCSENTSGNRYAEAMVDAFGFLPILGDNFFRYSQTPGHKTFIVQQDEKVIAGAGYFLSNGYCDLGMAGTRPAYQGMGLQKDLIQARLIDAKKNQATKAFSVATPGSISFSNLEKLGFQSSYLRLKFFKPL